MDEFDVLRDAIDFSVPLRHGQPVAIDVDGDDALAASGESDRRAADAAKGVQYDGAAQEVADLQRKALRLDGEQPHLIGFDALIPFRKQIVATIPIFLGAFAEGIIDVGHHESIGEHWAELFALDHMDPSETDPVA